MAKLTEAEIKRVLTDTWDTVRDIMSSRPPFWKRKPEPPSLLKAHDFSPVEEDGATGDLFQPDDPKPGA